MIISISHKSDFDGIASGALIVRYHLHYQPSQALILLKDYSDGANIVEETLYGLSPEKLYIADISTSFEQLGEVLERLKKVKPKEAIWFDHHPTNTLREVEGAGVKCNIRVGAPSTASVVFEKLYEERGIKDDVASTITRMATDIDTWKFEIQGARDVVDLVAFYNYLDDGNPLTPHLKSYLLYLASLDWPKLIGEWHLVQIELYRRKVAEQEEIIRRTATTFNILGLKAAIAFSPSIISSSRAADVLLDFTGAQVAIIVKENGTGSVRRRGSDIDVSRIAKVFGGGGHPYAAGMRLRDGKITLEEFLGVAKWVIEKLSSLRII